MADSHGARDVDPSEKDWELVSVIAPAVWVLADCVSPNGTDASVDNTLATIRPTTRITSAGIGSGVQRMNATARSDASSRSPATTDCSSFVRSRPRRASTSSTLASAILSPFDQMVADLHAVRDRVASGEHLPVDMDDAFQVVSDLHQDRTVATIDATGLTSTGNAIAFECTHSPIGSLVLYTPTAMPGCSLASRLYSGSSASRVGP